MTRYKTISFDDFSDGEQCDAIEPTEKSFKLSENLVIKKNGVKLGPEIKGGVLYDSGLKMDIGTYQLDFVSSSYLYLLGTDNVNCFIKSFSLTSATWTTIVTMPDSGIAAFYFIKFRGIVIANYRDNAGSTYLVKYSTDGMGMTTFADTNLVTLSGISDFRIIDDMIVHDRLYILGSDNKIYYSDDGVTFTLLVALDSVYKYYSLEYLSGYLYVEYHNANSGSGLLRISLSGDIQDLIVSFSVNIYLHHRIFAGNSYILVDQKKLYRVDGANLVLIFEFKDDVDFLASSGFINSLFFWDYVNKVIFEMNADEKISRPFRVLSSVNGINSIRKNYNGVIGSLQAISGGTASVAVYGVSTSLVYTASGNVQTRLLKAQSVPKQLVLRHNPLSANAWVKVYVKIDQASAWSSAVITSDVDGAVKATYDFPAGTELDFIEFKIEYGTDDSAGTPENVTLDYIYLPVGLSNSK